VLKIIHDGIAQRPKVPKRPFENVREKVGQASSLTVHGASLPGVRGGKMPPEPADKMSAPPFKTGSKRR